MWRFLPFIFLLTLSASAQTSFTGMRVLVTDHDGAVIPGAKVAAVHNETHRKWTAQTNLAGECLLPNLALGKYTVTVTKRGFHTETMQVVIDNFDHGLVRVDVRLRCSKCVVESPNTSQM